MQAVRGEVNANIKRKAVTFYLSSLVKSGKPKRLAAKVLAGKHCSAVRVHCMCHSTVPSAANAQH